MEMKQHISVVRVLLTWKNLFPYSSKDYFNFNPGQNGSNILIRASIRTYHALNSHFMVEIQLIAILIRKIDRNSTYIKNGIIPAILYILNIIILHIARTNEIQTAITNSVYNVIN